jgi:hypothetical protein
VYRPVTTGIPAMRAYPNTSGTASAANVTPANASGPSRDLPIGTKAPNIGNLTRLSLPSPIIRRTASREAELLGIADDPQTVRGEVTSPSPTDQHSPGTWGNAKLAL